MASSCSAHVALVMPHLGTACSTGGICQEEECDPPSIHLSGLREAARQFKPQDTEQLLVPDFFFICQAVFLLMIITNYLCRSEQSQLLLWEADSNKRE